MSADEPRFTVRLTTTFVGAAAAPQSLNVIEFSTRGEDYTMSVAEAEDLIARLKAAVALADARFDAKPQPREK